MPDQLKDFINDLNKEQRDASPYQDRLKPNGNGELVAFNHRLAKTLTGRLAQSWQLGRMLIPHPGSDELMIELEIRAKVVKPDRAAEILEECEESVERPPEQAEPIKAPEGGPDAHRGNVKLSEIEVLKIFQRVKAGERVTVLAREFGVSPQTVSGIITGRSWRKVTGLPEPEKGPGTGDSAGAEVTPKP